MLSDPANLYKLVLALALDIGLSCNKYILVSLSGILIKSLPLLIALSHIVINFNSINIGLANNVELDRQVTPKGSIPFNSLLRPIVSIAFRKAVPSLDMLFSCSSPVNSSNIICTISLPAKPLILDTVDNASR